MVVAGDGFSAEGCGCFGCCVLVLVGCRVARRRGVVRGCCVLVLVECRVDRRHGVVCGVVRGCLGRGGFFPTGGGVYRGFFVSGGREKSSPVIYNYERMLCIMSYTHACPIP